MSYILQEIPNIISYLFAGLLIIRIWGFITFSSPNTNFENKIFNIFLFGFTSINLLNFLISLFSKYFNINIDIDKNIILIFELLIIAIGTLGFGKLYMKYGIHIFKKISSYRTVNKYIWYDILDDNEVYLTSFDFGNKIICTGIIQTFEESSRNPQVILKDFILENFNGNIILKSDKDKNEYFLLDVHDKLYIKLDYLNENKKF